MKRILRSFQIASGLKINLSRSLEEVGCPVENILANRLHCKRGMGPLCLRFPMLFSVVSNKQSFVKECSYGLGG